MDFSPVFWDPDGDPITIIPVGNVQIDVSQQNGSLNLTFRPRPDVSGFSEMIRLTAKDDKGLGDNYVMVKVTVVPVNDPPRITKFSPGTDVVMSENQSFEINISAYDPESGPVVNYTWYLDDQPVMLGVFSYVYRTDFSSAGCHTVMVSVNDGELFTTKTWNVTVLNVNREPADVKIITPKPGDQYKEASLIQFEGSATDLDGDSLEYAWFEGSKELGKGRTLSQVLAPGAHAVVLQVFDGTATVKTHPLTFSVKPNALPQLYSLDPSNGQKFEKGARIHFVATAGDTDNDPLTFNWTENGKTLSSASSFYKSDLSPGTHLIRLTLSDGKTATDTNLTIEITQPPAKGPDVMLLAGIGGVIAAVIVVAVIAVLLSRKRKPPVIQEAMRVEETEDSET